MSGCLFLALGGVLGIVARGTIVLGWDLAAARLARRPPSAGLDMLAWAASRAGDVWPAWLLVAAIATALLAWRGRADLALFMLAATSLRAAGPPLKAIFASPRPMADVAAILEIGDGYGYPSGHALGAALVYGAIAVALPRVTPNVVVARGVRVAALVMLLLIAWSRVRLGAHWTSDVLGGLAIGLGFVSLLHAAVLCWEQRPIRT